MSETTIVATERIERASRDAADDRCNMAAQGDGLHDRTGVPSFASPPCFAHEFDATWGGEPATDPLSKAEAEVPVMAEK